ncbi:DUF5107 domain-containing protein [Luteolibacter arcticus]|uniref:DUF5107 domain-containing protein n=1 Tax=Luteolibacter arcticus TaxID=1581411 RepID=A0ABT3GK59_9BACT|nr:DUF5107 domain-containing protein [Luteolibacter arcticus]MCW1923882.1 DUF5107 domain-containing protein [Luteolibacter arcticus]
MSVIAKLESLVIPTYPVGEPEKNPLFFEKRVYQGSNGKVYPVPFIDKVHDHPEQVCYRSARLENELVKLVMLPEIGGRIFIGQDKSNRDYDFFYRQDVIKPALVGLAGPWISGGVEFNWPQHHRPGTFLPADVAIEEEPDGVRTIWFSEHDPIHRLKGMHGIRLRPGSSLIELRGRLFNRTAMTRTFLWWANVAARVHDRYQAFFPPDVHYVADHAVRAQSSFPHATQPYYGVPYQERPGKADLSWYKNIPVPTSYMVCQTRFDFFGGYDFEADGGFVHVADRHIAPGKKQWTWGNHDFGYAWDRELTDTNGPYVELMAGVYTDNQPDFSYLLPYETKTFSQFWWPIQGLGPVQNASTRAALRLVVDEKRGIDFGVAVPEAMPGARIVLREGERILIDETVDLVPGPAWRKAGLRLKEESERALSARVYDGHGKEVLSYRPVDRTTLVRERQVATQPAAPAEMASADELYFTGEHLEQYRHPTRAPELYWEEALRRDPADARCRTALGRRALERGEFVVAAEHLRIATGRLTSHHPNPVNGEAHYYLGITLGWLDDGEGSRDALAKSAWNAEWRGAANYQLAALDCRSGEWQRALGYLEEALDVNRRNAKAIVLKARCLRHLGLEDEAVVVLDQALAHDPLDHWARWEREGGSTAFAELTRNDGQTILDLAFDYIGSGFREEAVRLIRWHHAHPVPQSAVPNPLAATPMTRYLLAWLLASAVALEGARPQSPDRFFPSRLEEYVVLLWAVDQPGNDPVAAYALGNFLYDRKRHGEAIAAWERSLAEGAKFATVHRNLGIAYWNQHRDGLAARASYEKALAADPCDARLLAEFDQLRKKLNDPLADRLTFLEERRQLVLERDDCAVELATLYNLTGQPARALELLTTRRFHPWEGGEGSVLRQFTTAHLALGREALEAGDAKQAYAHFSHAMDTPANLGEAYHLLQAKADVNYWLGRSLIVLGREEKALRCFEASAAEDGDFSDMAVTAHSPLSWFRGLSLRELGQRVEAREFFESLRAFGEAKLDEKAEIDYFATSLPNLLVFDEDLQARRDAENHLLIAIACHGLSRNDEALHHLERTLAFSNSDAHAVELSRRLACRAEEIRRENEAECSV